MDFRQLEGTETFRDFSDDERKQLAKEGKAMPDGSFPTPARSNLEDAIKAIGRAKNNAASAVKAYLKRRARALGAADLIPEGWTETTDHVVAFASPSVSGGVSKPFEVLRVGDFRRGDRSVPVTSADLDTAVANFNRWKAMGQEIPIDYDHAFSEGREAPAAGWYDSLERKGDSLYATVRWTDKARDEIASGAYRFFSPEFTRQFLSETGQEEGFTILAGALTNRPFLRGMTPVALSQEVATVLDQEAEAAEAWKRQREAEAAADTPAEVARRDDKGNEIETFKVEIDGEEQELTADEIVALHQKAAKVDDLEQQVKDKGAEAAASKSQVETLSGRIESLENDAKDRDFNELFKQAQNEGRLDGKDETRTTWRETFDQLGTEKTRKLIEQIPAETVPLSAQGRSGGEGGSGPAGAPKGVHAENYALNQKVEAYMAEHPDVEFGNALNIILEQERVKS